MLNFRAIAPLVLMAEGAAACLQGKAARLDRQVQLAAAPLFLSPAEPM